jgi:hypothetical protein
MHEVGHTLGLRHNFRASTAYPLAKVSDPTWSIKAAADVDGDGRDDLVWRNTSDPSVYVWFTNGLQTPVQTFAGSQALNWTLAGVGDLDGDGKKDLVWRDTTTGDVEAWLMNGASHTVAPATESALWQLVGLADVNGDGYSDVVWHKPSTNEAKLWLIGAGVSITEAALPAVGAGWTYQGRGDANADGRQDIFWRNTAGDGAVYVWLLNGASVLSETQVGPAVGDFNWNLLGTIR